MPYGDTEARKFASRMSSMGHGVREKFHLQLVPGDVQGTMKHAKDVYVSAVFYKISNAVVSIEQYTDMAR